MVQKSHQFKKSLKGFKKNYFAVKSWWFWETTVLMEEVSFLISSTEDVSGNKLFYEQQN